MPVIDHLLSYAQRIRDLRRAHAAVQEPALAPAFQDLLSSILAELPVGARLTVVPESPIRVLGGLTSRWCVRAHRHGHLWN